MWIRGGTQHSTFKPWWSSGKILDVHSSYNLGEHIFLGALPNYGERMTKAVQVHIRVIYFLRNEAGMDGAGGGVCSSPFCMFTISEETLGPIGPT